MFFVMLHRSELCGAVDLYQNAGMSGIRLHTSPSPSHVVLQKKKHVAVMQLKVKQDKQGAQPPRSTHSALEVDATVLTGLHSSDGSAVPKPALRASGDQGAATDASLQQEGQVQSCTALPPPRANKNTGGAVLPLGVVVNVPTFPPEGGFIVPRLFGTYDHIDLKMPQQDESGPDVAAQAGVQKRARVDDEPDAVRNKIPVTAAGLLPPPQPLANNHLAGASTLPPAPVTSAASGGPAQRLKLPDPPGMGPLPSAGGGRFSDDPRPRFQGSDVFGGVRGSSGSQRRPEKGSFIDQAPGFLPRAPTEDGEELLRCAALPQQHQCRLRHETTVECLAVPQQTLYHCQDGARAALIAV